MARINIEDRLYRDQRFIDLVIATGNADAALGALVRAWSLAQSFYLTESRMIPLSAWESQRISAHVLSCGLATRVGDYIRVAGSDDQFGWLLQKSGAGQESAKKRKQKKSTGVQRASTGVNGRSTFVHGSQPLTPSPSPSPSPSQAPTQTHTQGEGVQGEAVRPSSAKPTLPLLVEIWNRESGALPKARGADTKRTKAAKARFAEMPDESYWTEVVKRVAASDFCKGASEKKWVATIDWLLQPGAHLKVMEGNYDNRSGKLKPPESESARRSREYIERLEREAKEVLL